MKVASGAVPRLMYVLLVIVVAVAYLIVVAPGLPYDEPAHWANVLYIAHHGTLPVLGRDASYEAQMGPVAYYIDAIPLMLARLFGFGDRGGFYGARLLGVPLLLAFYFLVLRLLRGALPTPRGSVVSVAAAVATLNPMVVTMGMSVQNDLLALVLAAAALTVALPEGGPRRPWASGLLTGLAVLTKLTAWPVAPVIVIVFLRRKQPWRAVTVVVATVVVSGWWFVRNLALYGDLTGQRGVTAAGYDFPPYQIDSLGGVIHVASQVVTYLWIPNEYLRNSIHAPSLLKALLILVTAAIAVAATLQWRCAPRPGALAAVSILAIGGWLVTYVSVQAVPPRIAYCALLGWAAMTALALTRMSTRSLIVAVGTLLLGLHLVTLLAVAMVSSPAFVP